MLGIIGFTAAALVFGLYAYSLRAVQTKDSKLRMRSFRWAYYLLALACWVWALGIASGLDGVLVASVIFGNVAILAATIALVDAVTNAKYRIKAVTALAAAAVLFVGARLLFLMPEPFIINGILVFNSQPVVSVVLGVLFIGVWLPVNLYVSKRITANQGVLPLQSISAIAFITATLGVIVFLAAHRPATLVLSFGVLCCAFASLAGVNYLKRKEIG